MYVFVFQAEDGIRDAHELLEFRRVLFRSAPAMRSSAPATTTRASVAARLMPALSARVRSSSRSTVEPASSGSRIGTMTRWFAQPLMASPAPDHRHGPFR